MIETQRLIDNYIYFYHLDKFCVIPVYPERISDTLKSKFSETNALARSAPVFSYNNSGPRTLSVDLKLHRDLMNDVNKNVSNLKDNVIDFNEDDYIDTLIKYLQSIAMPRYRNISCSRSVIPPMIAIRFGNEIFIKGVVNGTVEVSYEMPILYNGKYAQVSIRFTVSETDPYSADDVVDYGSFRGLTKSFKDGIYKSTASNPSINEVSTDESIKSLDHVSELVNRSNGEIMQYKKPYFIHTSSSGISHGGGGGSFSSSASSDSGSSHTSSSGTSHGGGGGKF